MKRLKNQSVWIKLSGILTLLLILSFGLGSRPALAHGGAELAVSPAVVAPGSSITVSAEGVEAGEVFTLTLEGVTFQATLGTVSVGDESFRQEFTIPADTPPGSYQVQAASAEGEGIVAELTVAGSAAATQPSSPATPTANPMPLNRPRTGGELAVMIAGLLVSAGLGLALVRMRG
jgi:hypothetical protein